MTIPEDLGGEGEELDAGLLPRVVGKAGLPAGLDEEGLAIPPVLPRDLREEDAAAAVAADEQAVPSHLDVLRADRLERRERGDLDRQMVELRLGHGLEPAVLDRGRHRHPGHRLEERAVRAHQADAPPQLPVTAVQGDEGAPVLGEGAGRGRQRRLPRAEVRRDRLASGPEERLALRVRQLAGQGADVGRGDAHAPEVRAADR